MSFREGALGVTTHVDTKFGIGKQLKVLSVLSVSHEGLLPEACVLREDGDSV